MDRLLLLDVAPDPVHVVGFGILILIAIIVLILVVALIVGFVILLKRRRKGVLPASVNESPR